MIVVSLRVLVPPENRRELLQTIRSLLNPISNQTGCLGSHCYVEVGDNAAVCLIEEWETQTDMDNHMRSDIFAVLLGALNLLKGRSEIEFKVLSLQAGIETVDAARGKIDPWNSEDTDSILVRNP
jgi:quinol monooxygenase YgiN